MPKLYRLILPVSDIEHAVRFYSRVLGEAGERISPGRHYFDCEGTILACYDPRADGDPQDAAPIPEPIYFAVDDLEQTYQNAKAAGASLAASQNVPGVGPLGRIVDRPWGERSFYAVDPFGNELCFVSRETVFTGK